MSCLTATKVVIGGVSEWNIPCLNKAGEQELSDHEYEVLKANQLCATLKALGVNIFRAAIVRTVEMIP
jgi:hypothetical protein